uniref:Hipothetical protein n=1 Tax=Xenopsylla cheopis TaxID=163159 RepID=A0A6M2DSQ1_XENCH
MTCEKNKLVEVPVDDWKKLRDLFKSNWPRHVLPYLAIENFERLKTTHLPSTKIFCLNGDWSDGTFILKDGRQITMYTLQESCQRLYEALMLYDWSEGSAQRPYDSAHKHVLQKVRAALKLKISKEYELDNDGAGCTYWISKEQALLFDDTPPSDCEIRNLEDKDSTIINSLWPYGTPETEAYFKLMIAINPSRGLYGKEKNDLRCWVLSHANGVLMALQTSPHHLRKGYGELILKSMAKLKAQMGQDTIASIVPENVKSRNLFSKLNFKEIGITYWSGTDPF